MSAFYNSLAKTADRLIKSKGQAATLRLHTEESGDKPWNPKQSSSNDYSVIAVVLTAVQVARSYDDQTFTRTSQKYALISAKSEIPKLDGLLIIGQDQWKITGIDDLNPGGTMLLYKVFISQ